MENDNLLFLSTLLPILSSRNGWSGFSTFLSFFQLSKSLPASLQGDEPTETDDEGTKGPQDERQSYVREKRFWKRGSKSTSIMSTGNVAPSVRASPTSVMHDRKSPTTNQDVAYQVDWQKIPKVEIVQHEDTVKESEKNSVFVENGQALVELVQGPRPGKYNIRKYSNHFMKNYTGSRSKTR